jgi:hypothetical protein
LRKSVRLPNESWRIVMQLEDIFRGLTVGGQRCRVAERLAYHETWLAGRFRQA